MTAPRQWSDDHKASEGSAYDSFFDRVYRHAFPDLLYTLKVSNRADQAKGIDRVVIKSREPHGLRVDEKLRARDYGDLLLEASIREHDGSVTPGWIEKDLKIDLIAYGVADRWCRLIPWPALRAAWRAHGDAWKARAKSNPRYLAKRASTTQGRIWTAFSVLVSWPELDAVVPHVTRVDLEANP